MLQEIKMPAIELSRQRFRRARDSIDARNANVNSTDRVPQALSDIGRRYGRPVRLPGYTNSEFRPVCVPGRSDPDGVQRLVGVELGSRSASNSERAPGCLT